MLTTTTTTTMAMMTTMTMRAWSRKGGDITSKWDFKEVARRRRAMEDDSTAQEDVGGGWCTCKDVVLYCGWSLIAYTGIKYKKHMRRNQLLYDTRP
jgi:hypothetical protein